MKFSLKQFETWAKVQKLLTAIGLGCTVKKAGYMSSRSLEYDGEEVGKVSNGGEEVFKVEVIKEIQVGSY